MKVTKKVGRRSRKYTSSISRRRLRNKKNNKNKSSYKKRYGKTQKGGKRGRGEKHMRVRTHKRGKRFHRGGFECKFTPNGDNYELTISKKQLYVKKNGELFQSSPTQEFNVTLSVKTGRKCIQDLSTSQSSTPTQFVVTFTRTTPSKKDNKNVSFNISDLSYFTDKNKQKQTKRVQNINETYVFSNSENNSFFDEIKSCIETELLKQQEEIKAYYKEVKDLLEHCKIVILSSVEKQSGNVTPNISVNYTSGFTAWSGVNLTPKPPFFSFLFFVYVDTSGNIDIDKTKKLVELLSSLSNYGLFFLQKTNGQPYTEEDSPLKKLQNFIDTGESSILTKITDSVRQCSSLIGILNSHDSLTITTDMVGFVKSIEDLRSTGIGNSSQSLLVPTDKIWEVFTKIKNSPNSDSFVDLTRTDGLTLQNLTEYVDGNADFFNGNQEEKDDFLQRLSDSTSKLSDKEIEKQKIQSRELKVDDVIRQLGENIEAHPNDTNSKVRSYSDFKAEQESKAAELKKQIDGLPINEDEKEKRKANVDFYLKKILETQLDYMKRRYRAFYIYQDFPKPRGPDDTNTNTENGLYQKDKTYKTKSVLNISNMLQTNVAAFQFRMEKQAENPIGEEYSDLVSTPTDDSNYENLFKGCEGPSQRSSGNATQCYTQLQPDSGFDGFYDHG